MLFALFLGGCAVTPPAQVQQPMSARAADHVPRVHADGAIYHGGEMFRPLFEDRRARRIGDTLTVSIAEKTSASKKTKTSAERSAEGGLSIATVQGVPGKSAQGAELEASGDVSFEGGGESAANNDFSGRITVTVIEVLANGNLVVSGEKQIAINNGVEYVRLSGVVHPDTIGADNSVSSTQIADARIEYKGNGFIDEAQRMGWLQRLLLNLSPF